MDRTLSAVALACALTTAAAHGADGTQRAEVFVGDVKNSGALIAVHSRARPRHQRELAVYVCDGRSQELTLWFRGVVSGKKSFALTGPSNHAMVTGNFIGKKVTGTLTLADATQLEFEAAQTSGFSGIYNVVIFADGRFEADAFEGDREIQGQRTVGGGGGTIQGQFIFPSGRTKDFTGTVSLPGEPGAYRSGRRARARSANPRTNCPQPS